MSSASIYAAQLLAFAALFIRLAASRLLVAYPLFSMLVGFEFMRVAIMLAVPSHTNAHAYFYFFSQPLSWTLHALAVFEVFQRALKAHPGIATVGRRAVMVAVVLSAVLSVGTLLIRAQMPDSPYVNLERYLLLERVINSSLLGFLMVLLAFLAYFPVPLTRNALVHTSLFGFYFLIRTTLWIFRNLIGPEFTQTMNLVMGLFMLIALSAWAILLNRAGEATLVRSSRRTSKVEEQRLIAQLEAINRTLMRSVEK